MSLPFITFTDTDPKLNWLDLVNTLDSGHLLPKAQVCDVFMNQDQNNILSRHAWIKGLGIAVKTATIFPKNKEYGHFAKLNETRKQCLYCDRSFNPGNLSMHIDKVHTHTVSVCE